MACFFGEKFLRETLRSLAAQEFANWELIVVEDGSHDGTEAIVQAFRSEVNQTVIFRRLDVNAGVSSARNEAARLAQGEFIAFLDSDDVWVPTHLSSLLSTHILTHADVVSCTVIPFNSDTGQNYSPYATPRSLIGCSPLAIFEAQYCILPSGILLTRAIFIKVSGFDTAFSQYEDRELCIRLARIGAHFEHTGQATLLYRKHKNSVTSKAQLMAKAYVRVYEKHGDWLDIPVAIRTQMRAQSKLACGRLLKYDEPRSALRYFWDSARLKPVGFLTYVHLIHALMVLLRQRNRWGMFK